MENLAFLHASTAYEDPSEAPTLRSLEDMGLAGTPAMMGASIGLVAGLAVLGQAPDAHALVGYGDRGSAVSDVQSVLSDWGYNPGGVDGVFGADTEAAVKRFQTFNGITVDGVVGPSTAAKLGLSGPEFGTGSGGGGGGSSSSVTISTNGGALTVRSGPGTSYAAIDYLSNGTSVGVVSSSNGWYQISGGGWISSAWTVGGGGSSGGGGGSSGGAGRLVISTNGSELVARSGPGTSYGITGGYANGAVVSFYDYYAGWYETDQGWVSSSWAYEL